MSKAASSSSAASSGSGGSWFSSPWLYIGGAVALGMGVGLTMWAYNSDKKQAAKDKESRHILEEVEHKFDTCKSDILDHIELECKSWNKFDRTKLEAIYTHFRKLLDIDKQHVGIISRHTFEEVMTRLGVEDDLVQSSLYRVFDKNGDGHIDFVELVRNLNEVVWGSTKDRLHRYFRIFDLDGNGSITRDELHKLFATFIKGVTEEQLNTWVTGAMAAMDLNLDRRVSYTEFEKYCTDPMRTGGTPGSGAGAEFTFSQKLQGGFERNLLAAFGVAPANLKK